MTAITRALISVSDKTGVVPLAQALAQHGIELISTGGTARTLRDAGLEVRDVSELTQSPEMMDGRVKTLHPAVHAGILARRDNPDDLEALRRHSFAPIDMVVVNLYPFEATIAQKGVSLDEAIEKIDIGGPTMVRAAAKNHAHVTIVTSPDDYSLVTNALSAHEGAVPPSLRTKLAAKAFLHTAQYDAAIANYLGERFDDEASPLPATWGGPLTRRDILRYGENPHQAAALYEGAGGSRSLAAARILQGKALSYNNWVDADAAFQLARDLGPSSVTVIKHTNPCGAATSERSLVEAYRKARACDPVSSFGGIVATPGTIDVAFAQELVETFLEVIIASDVDADAREILSRKKNLRVLVVPPSGWRQEVGSLACRAIAGGWLLQQTDVPNEDLRQGKVVTKRHPTESEWQALAFNWRVATHVKSNAIVFGQADRTLAIGAGQMSRVESAKLGVMKALGPRDEGNIQSFFRAVADTIGQQEHDLMGTAVASDAFFPFADGLEACAQAGASCVVQPGGSRRDAEVIAAADRLGMAMVFSGRRHFRH